MPNVLFLSDEARTYCSKYSLNICAHCGYYYPLATLNFEVPNTVIPDPNEITLDDSDEENELVKETRTTDPNEINLDDDSDDDINSQSNQIAAPNLNETSIKDNIVDEQISQLK